MFFQALGEALKLGYGLHLTTRLGVRHAQLSCIKDDAQLLPTITGTGRTIEEALALVQENFLRMTTGVETMRSGSFISGWPTRVTPLDIWIHMPGHRVYWAWKESGFQCSFWTAHVLVLPPSDLQPTLEMALTEALARLPADPPAP